MGKVLITQKLDHRGLRGPTEVTEKGGKIGFTKKA
jgi:hypothetical protein